MEAIQPISSGIDWLESWWLKAQTSLIAVISVSPSKNTLVGLHDGCHQISPLAQTLCGSVDIPDGSSHRRFICSIRVSSSRGERKPRLISQLQIGQKSAIRSLDALVV
jgi:hypothetical protein